MRVTVLLAAVAASMIVMPVEVRAQGRDPATSRKIRAVLEEAVKESGVPGMLAAVADAEGLIGTAEVGVRKAGEKAAITEKDLVHLGSCTKAMTCVLLATLVADGKLTWKTTVAEVFPKLKKKVHAAHHDVTLWDLVTHRSGLAANSKNWWAHGGQNIAKTRLAQLKENLKEPPPGERGKYVYSNLGYMVAACMAEKVMKRSWEELIAKRVFKPLRMSSAGFGPPGPARGAKQPWGHTRADGGWKPHHADNAPALGPAGTVHCSLADWSRFLALLMEGAKPAILGRSALDELITPPSGDYAGGWIVGKTKWASGLTLGHDGSNTMWYATVTVAPGLNRAYIVVTNSCDDASGKLCSKVKRKLVDIDRAAANNQRR